MKKRKSRTLVEVHRHTKVRLKHETRWRQASRVVVLARHEMRACVQCVTRSILCYSLVRWMPMLVVLRNSVEPDRIAGLTETREPRPL